MLDEKTRDSIKVLFSILLLTILNFYIPLISILVIFIWPIPVVYMAVKHGMKQVSIIIAIAAVLNGVFFGPLMGLVTIIGFGFIGFVIGGSLLEDFPPIKVLILSIFAVLFSQLIFVLVSQYLMGLNFNQVLSDALRQLQGNGDLDQVLQMQIELIKLLSPAFLVISSIITGSLTYYISIWYLNTYGYQQEKLYGLKYWHFPRWYVSLGIVISLIFKGNSFFMNLNIILLFLVFVQGFAVGLYLVSKKTDSIFFKSLYIALVIFIPLMPVVLILLGLVDLWFNLRRLKKQAG